MKKLFLTIAACTSIVFSALSQEVNVPIKNFNFDEPAYIGQIKDGLGIPNWTWMGEATDSGREVLTFRTSKDSLIGYLYNKDPKMIQVTDESIGNGTTKYNVNFQGKTAWADAPSASIITYVGATLGADTVMIDSITTELTSDWLEHGVSFTMPGNSIYSGKKLVIGFSAITSNSRDGWIYLDSITMTKIDLVVNIPVSNYSFDQPAYTGQIKDGLGIPNWIWMGKATDSGRELASANYRTAEDSLVCYLYNKDPKVVQVTNNLIPSDQNDYLYSINFLSKISWTNASSASIAVYIGAKHGNDTVVFDSTEIVLSNDYELYHAKFTINKASEYANDFLSIGFKDNTSDASEAWINIDSISVTREMIFVKDTINPSTPENLVAELNSMLTGINKLSWNASTDNSNMIKGYVICINNDSIAYTTSPYYADFGDLSLGNYNIGVIAVDGSGNRSDTAKTVITLAIDTEKPSKPASLTSTVNNDKVTLKWKAGTDNSGVIEKYIIYKNGNPIDTLSKMILTISGLENGEYKFAVAQVDPSGNVSDTIQVTAFIDVINGVNSIPCATFSAYPNPFNDVITVTGNEDIVALKLYDLNGILIASKIVNGNNATMNVLMVKSGIYILKIESKKGTIIKQLVK